MHRQRKERVLRSSLFSFGNQYNYVHVRHTPVDEDGAGEVNLRILFTIWAHVAKKTEKLKLCNDSIKDNSISKPVDGIDPKLFNNCIDNELLRHVKDCKH